MAEKYDLSIERAIIATILYQPELVEDILDRVKSDSFYHPTHRAIYETIEFLAANNMPVDDSFIRQKYKGNDFSDDVFFDILATTPLSNIAPYAIELGGLSKIRKTEHILRDGLSRLNSGEQVDVVLSDLEVISTKTADENVKKLTMHRASEIDSTEADFFIKDWLPIPKKTVTAIGAAGGTGKTTLLLQAALRIAQETKRDVFLWLSEDAASQSKWRLTQICSIYPELEDFIQYIIICDDLPVLLLRRSKDGFIISPEFYKIQRQLRDYEVIVLDPMLGFYGGDENDNSQARIFMQPFMNWANEENKSIIFIMHSSKEGKIRGAGAFIDACRSAYSVSRVYQKNKVDLDPANMHNRTVKLEKDNYGAFRHLGSSSVVRQIMPEQSSRALYEEKIYNDKQDFSHLKF